MSFSGAQRRLQEAVFARLGEDAEWEGLAEPVRVRRREEDETAGFGQAAEIVTTRFLWVRKADVPAPAEGQTVQILDEAGSPLADARFRLIAEPRGDRKGVWRCEVEPLAAE
jgi:hypothetical protein